MLRTYGTNEVIHGLPMLLTLEDYWNVPEEYSTRNKRTFNIEIYKHLRLFFIAYLVQVSRDQDCSGLNRVCEELKNDWGNSNLLPKCLTFDGSAVVKSIGSASGTVRLVFEPMNAMLKNIENQKNHDGGSSNNMTNNGNKNDIGSNDSDEKDDILTVNRQELLTVLLLGKGFRAEAVSIRQVTHTHITHS